MRLFRDNQPGEQLQSNPAEKNNPSYVDADSSGASIGDSRYSLPFLTGLYNLGFKRAISAGITQISEAFLLPLEEHARGIAREFSRSEFDPDKHLHDRLEFDEYNRALKNREDARVGEDHAVARLRQAKRDLDATKKVGDRPRNPVLLIVISISMIAVSLTATVHDRLMPVGIDPMLSIVLSMLIGTMLGAAPVYSIFHGRNSGRRHFGLAVGLLLAIALFAVRAAGVESTSELLYAGGWAMLELAGVLLAEYFSHAHRKAETEWEETHHSEAAAEAAVASAHEDVELWRTRIAATQSEMNRISNLVHDRNSRALRADDIEELCVKAVRDGASAGVAHNLGIVRGLTSAVRPIPIQVVHEKETL